MTNPAAAPASQRRRKDWVMLRSYLFEDSETVPKGPIDVIKSSISYLDQPKMTGRKHFSGVYGTNSGDAGAFLASNWAARNGKQVYFLDVWAEIPNFHTSRAQMTRQILRESHWLHVDRMSVDFRDEVKELMMGWIRRKHGQSENVQDLTISQLLLRHPWLAIKLLDEDDDIGMIVHPVHTLFDHGNEKQLSIWAATIRTDRLPVQSAEIRFRPDIPCHIIV